MAIFVILIIIFSVAIVAASIIVPIVIVAKRHRQISSFAGRVSNIVDKALDNIEGELDKRKPQKIVMVNCPFCGTPNKDTDTKCSSCRAPLSK